MWEGFPFSTFWSAVSFSRLFHGGHSICSLVIACCFCELNFSTNNWHLASFPVLLFWNLYGWNLYLQMVFLKVRPLMNSLLHTPGHLLKAVVIHSRRGLLNGKWPLLLLFSRSVVSNSATRWAAAGHASCPSPFPWARSNSCPLSRWCHPTISSSVVPFSSCPQSFPPSGSFFNESALHIRCPKYWSFSFSISPSKEYSGLISFRINWFDLLAIQRTLKSLQHNSSKASVLRHSAFFYGPTLTSIHDYWKNHSFD